MTYQELVKCYPWVDLAWEIFKGISPTILGLVTVLLTEHFIRKRDALDKRKKMQIQYLEKILAWVHDTRKDIFEINSALSKTLCKKREERELEYKKNKEMITEMNKSVFIWCDTYNDITKCFGYDFKLENLKESVNCYSKQIVDIGQRYLGCANTDDSIDEINAVMAIVMKKMQESISSLVETIDLLYENKNIIARLKRKMRISVKCLRKDKGGMA